MSVEKPQNKRGTHCSKKKKKKGKEIMKEEQ